MAYRVVPKSSHYGCIVFCTWYEVGVPGVALCNHCHPAAAFMHDCKNLLFNLLLWETPFVSGFWVLRHNPVISSVL